MTGYLSISRLSWKFWALFAVQASLMPYSSTAEPRPFIATYSANIDLLIDLPASAHRELKRSENGTWHFSNNASALMAKQQEWSELSYSNGQWIPLAYHYERKLLGRTRSIDINFDETKGRITTLVNGDPWRQLWEPRVQDRLSYQLQLREDLKSDREELDYRIADGGQIKNYRFTRLGQEILKTPAGEFECIRLQLDRQGQQHTTLIWMAPELDYLTVRLLRIDNEGREHLMNLKELEYTDEQR